MQAANRLRQALHTKNAAFGAWQMLPGTNLSRAICGASPHIDWVLIDQEHGNISDDSMHELVAAIAACGVSPIVRVVDGQQWMIKRALDAGAHGILVPLLQTAADAEDIVRSSKFPPQGNRGFGSPFSMDKFAARGDNGKQLSSIEYLQQANNSIVVAVQIETKAALDQVHEIAAVPGIDVLFVGPFDLGNNIGHPIVGVIRDPELDEAILSVQKAAQQHGKHSGIYCVNGKEANHFAEKGFGMVSALTDMVALPGAFAKALEAAMGADAKYEGEEAILAYGK